MRVAGMNWMQVEDRVRHDDRCVLPIGSVEQHGYLSLCVDMILAERVAVEPGDTTETLRARVQAVEHRLLPDVVRELIAS